MANNEANQIVYRPWGSYQSLASCDKQYQVKRLVVKPGAKLSLQYHHHRAEHWVVVQGTARAQVGEDFHQLSRNMSVYIPTGVKHRLENPSDDTKVVVIETQIGDYLGEDDIVRLDDAYGRV